MKKINYLYLGVFGVLFFLASCLSELDKIVTVNMTVDTKAKNVTKTQTFLIKESGEKKGELTTEKFKVSVDVSQDSEGSLRFVEELGPVSNPSGALTFSQNSPINGEMKLGKVFSYLFGFKRFAVKTVFVFDSLNPDNIYYEQSLPNGVSVRVAVDIRDEIPVSQAFTPREVAKEVEDAEDALVIPIVVFSSSEVKTVNDLVVEGAKDALEEENTQAHLTRELENL